uniref:Uncharacterized protein n=1 Tax=Rhizophora mucronata TaxID=61149 RepID=A0A2P2Q2U5_RHIMU
MIMDFAKFSTIIICLCSFAISLVVLWIGVTLRKGLLLGFCIIYQNRIVEEVGE